MTARWADGPFCPVPQLCILFRKGTLPRFVSSSKLVLIRSLNLISSIIPPGDQLLAALFKGILFLLATKEHAGPVQTSVLSRTDASRLVLFFLKPKRVCSSQRFSCWISPRVVWLSRTLRRTVVRKSACVASVLAQWVWFFLGFYTWMMGACLWSAVAQFYKEASQWLAAWSLGMVTKYSILCTGAFISPSKLFHIVNMLEFKINCSIVTLSCLFCSLASDKSWGTHHL